MSILSEREVETIVTMACYTSEKVDGRESTTEAELRGILEWAEGVQLEHGMLANVLSGQFFIRFKDGEVSFQISPKGEAEVEAMGKPGEPKTGECPMCGGTGHIKTVE